MTEIEANASIAKLIAETATLNAELARTIAETRKLNVETPKLAVEAVNLGVLRGKLYLEIILYPMVVFGTWAVAVVGVLKFFGLLKG
jgi:ABC-type enterochelin transport system permease subunit